MKSCFFNKILIAFFLFFSGTAFDVLSQNDKGSDPHEEVFKDIIFLSDGSEISCIIKTVGTSYVTFEQYDSETPYSISVQLLDSIKFSNGKTRNFKQQTSNQTSTTTSKGLVKERSKKPSSKQKNRKR